MSSLRLENWGASLPHFHYETDQAPARDHLFKHGILNGVTLHYSVPLMLEKGVQGMFASPVESFITELETTLAEALQQCRQHNIPVYDIDDGHYQDGDGPSGYHAVPPLRIRHRYFPYYNSTGTVARLSADATKATRRLGVKLVGKLSENEALHQETAAIRNEAERMMADLLSAHFLYREGNFYPINVSARMGAWRADHQDDHIVFGGRRRNGERMTPGEYMTYIKQRIEGGAGVERTILGEFGLARGLNTTNAPDLVVAAFQACRELGVDMGVLNGSADAAASDWNVANGLVYENGQPTPAHDALCDYFNVPRFHIGHVPMPPQPEPPQPGDFHIEEALRLLNRGRGRMPPLDRVDSGVPRRKEGRGRNDIGRAQEHVERIALDPSDDLTAREEALHHSNGGQFLTTGFRHDRGGKWWGEGRLAGIINPPPIDPLGPYSTKQQAMVAMESR